MITICKTFSTKAADAAATCLRQLGLEPQFAGIAFGVAIRLPACPPKPIEAIEQLRQVPGLCDHCLRRTKKDRTPCWCYCELLKSKSPPDGSDNGVLDGTTNDR